MVQNIFIGIIKNANPVWICQTQTLSKQFQNLFWAKTIHRESVALILLIQLHLLQTLLFPSERARLTKNQYSTGINGFLNLVSGWSALLFLLRSRMRFPMYSIIIWKIFIENSLSTEQGTRRCTEKLDNGFALAEFTRLVEDIKYILSPKFME